MKLQHSLDRDFALRTAAAMDDLKSSHVYFVMQKAFGEGLDWNDAQQKLDAILNFCACRVCKKTIKEVRRTLKS